MLKTYYKNYEVKVNGKLVKRCQIGPVICDESEFPVKFKKIESGKTWITLACLIHNDGRAPYLRDAYVGFTFFRKRGYINFRDWDCSYYFYNDGKELDWEITFEADEVQLSLDRLFNLPDGDKVIEYLKERGMANCPFSIVKTNA